MSKVCEHILGKMIGIVKRIMLNFMSIMDQIPVSILIHEPIPVMAGSIDIVIGKSYNQYHTIHWIGKKQFCQH